jgi:hypothetical protein
MNRSLSVGCVLGTCCMVVIDHLLVVDEELHIGVAAEGA